MRQPPPACAADNDVVLKAVAYGLASDFWETSTHGSVGVLGTTRYVVARRLERGAINDRHGARERFDALLQVAAILEPSDDERRRAAELEAAAQEAGLPLDAGESQLCAIASDRGIAALHTGDKRAIAALEQLRKRTAVNRLEGRVSCLEQLVWRLLQDVAVYPRVASAVCAEKDADRAIAICFACHLPAQAAREAVLDGLVSYIEDLRRSAPSMLAG